MRRIVGKRIALILFVAGIVLLIAGVSLLTSQTGGSSGSETFPRAYLVSEDSQDVLEKDKLAPDIELRYSDGTITRLSDLRGRPVLVNFWATWCPFCEAEMPAIQQAYERYKEDGFVVLAVDSREADGTVADFVSDYNLTFTVAIDPTDAIFRMYRGAGWPQSVFVDRQGIVSDIYVGQLNSTLLEQFIGAAR